MKHKTLTIALLLASTATATAWAECTTNAVVEADEVTVVTVTAAASDEVCTWEDNNPNNNQVVFITGVAVPSLTSILGVAFEAKATIVDNGGRSYQEVRCNHRLACSENANPPISTSPSAPVKRSCSVGNPTSISATLVCYFL